MAEEKRTEIYVEDWKKYWKSTPYSEQLSNLISRVIEDRKESPISNVVCLAIRSSELSDKDSAFSMLRKEVQQFVLFSQIVSELAVNNPSFLQNVVVQDPSMKAGWRAVFKSHGFRIVEDPAAFDLVGPSTLLVAPFIPVPILAKELNDINYSGEVGMFFGNGESLLRVARQRKTLSTLLC